MWHILVDFNSSRGRFVLLFCKNCRNRFEVSSPDDKHIFAAQSKTAFEIPSPISDSSNSDIQKTSDDEVIESEHECPKCKDKNKIFWGAPKFA